MSVEAHTALLDADLVQDRRRRWGSELLFYATLGALVFAGFIALRGVWPPPALRDLDRGTMTVPQ